MVSGTTGLSIEAVRIQNLRGFSDARIEFTESPLFLVGPNNSGKTSLFRLLDVVMNWNIESEFAYASDELLRTLLPARETRNAARRISVWVRVADGRKHSRLKCENGVAELRISLRVSERKLRANLGPPRRHEAHEKSAVDFLNELRDCIDFIHIPAGRSVNTNKFEDSLNAAMTDALKFVIDKPGKGATAEERKTKKLVSSLKALVDPIDEFWKDFLQRLPVGWEVEDHTSSKFDVSTLVQMVVSQVQLGISTGKHDVGGVAPQDVGSGLQSLLELEIRKSLGAKSSKSQIFAVEEPEAFLHPSAQRRVGREFESKSESRSYLVSTHSPLILEEAAFENVAIIRRHFVHQPQKLDLKRLQINSQLMAGRVAEMFFAESVLLVEGPGDREYWEGLRRRVAIYDGTGASDRCYVVEAGGKSSFAPLVRMLESYPHRPIGWTAIMDIDGVAALRKCAKESGVGLSARQESILDKISIAWNGGSFSDADTLVKSLAKAAESEAPFLLAPIDLEHMMCASLLPATVSRISPLMVAKTNDPQVFAERLGTKCRPTRKSTSDPVKTPAFRRTIAEMTPPKELDGLVRLVLLRWLASAGSWPEAKKTWSKFVASK